MAKTFAGVDIQPAVLKSPSAAAVPEPDYALQSDGVHVFAPIAVLTAAKGNPWKGKSNEGVTLLRAGQFKQSVALGNIRTADGRRANVTLRCEVGLTYTD
jgi:hypothetical protein